MADVKISGLPASTTPLAGTEVLPIVQGGATKQVSIANVTAGRSVAALSVITPTIQAEAGSAGGTIKNGSGVAQMQWGSGGASNLSLEVATNINPANAAVNISPTGTGTVTINPAAASTMNNVAIGGTTPLAGKFTTLEATGVTTVQAGTVSAPAITTTGDTNTGIFFPAADTIAFTEGGVERARIISAGSFQINSTAVITNNQEALGVISLGAAGPAASFKNSAGVSSNCVEVWNEATSGDNKFINFITETSYTVRGNITYNRAGGLVAYNVTSDYRAKDIISPVLNSGEVIDSVPVYIGKMKGATQARPMFIAHETPDYAHTGEKDAVDKDGNPVYQQMDSSSLIPVLWAEIQSLRARLKAANIA